MLVVLDEACGIPKELWDAASSLAANVNGRTLAIGNPDDPFGEFAANCRAGSTWETIKVGYADTPNFTGEPISPFLSDMLIHPDWVEERRNKWGEESALFQSKCMGIFPEGSSPFVTVPITWAQGCQYNQMPETAVVECGIDVAAGGDRTVITERRGMRLGRMVEFTDPDPMKTVGRLVEVMKEWGVTKAKIDPIGIGWGIMGRLQELSTRHNPSSPECTHDVEIIGVNFAESPSEGKETLFLNKRAEVWWEVGREYSRLKLWDLENIDDECLQELTTPLYELMDSKGKIKIQAKKEVREILGRSPDKADSLLLAFYETQTVGAIVSAYDQDGTERDVLREAGL